MKYPWFSNELIVDSFFLAFNELIVQKGLISGTDIAVAIINRHIGSGIHNKVRFLVNSNFACSFKTVIF